MNVTRFLRTSKNAKQLNLKIYKNINLCKLAVPINVQNTKKNNINDIWEQRKKIMTNFKKTLPLLL